MRGRGLLPEQVVAIARELDLTLDERAPGGEVGAFFVRDSRGRTLVLKVASGKQRASRWERGVTIARRLRTVGYPAPEYVGVGASGELVWSLQERLAGETPHVLRRAHAARLLELAALHVDAAADLQPIGSEEPRLALSLEGLSQLQRDERTATIAAQVDRVLRRSATVRLRSSDACHGDYHHRNLLTEGDVLTGVFDWEGASCGDWRFDVATLAFWCTAAAHQVDDEATKMARRRAEEICDPEVLAYFTAALTARMLSFSLRAHPEFIAVVLPPIAERIVPWWRSVS
jgi:aminoglycoside phosphotransferase (APT) family kinase protein